MSIEPARISELTQHDLKPYFDFVLISKPKHINLANILWLTY